MTDHTTTVPADGTPRADLMSVCPEWCHGDHEPGEFHANDGAEIGLRDGGRVWVWMSTEDEGAPVRAAIGPEERIAAAEELPAMSAAEALRLALALTEHAWMACCITDDECPQDCTTERPDAEAAELALNFLELAVSSAGVRTHGPGGMPAAA